MGAALEIMIIPVLLITAIALYLADIHSGAVIAATLAGLALLYFVFVAVLRVERRDDATGDDDRRA